MKRATRVSIVLLASGLTFAACTIPAWVNTAENDAKVAVPIAASLIDVIDPALAPAVTLVENGFNALVKTLDAYKVAPTATNLQAVQSAFAAVNANVKQLEGAAQVKNAAAASKVTQVVGLLNQAVIEIAALVPPGTAAAVGVERPAGEWKQWKAADFKKAYNRIVKDDARFKPLK